jgi:diaminobutyrate-2-oxoglutarate transaminase
MTAEIVSLAPSVRTEIPGPGSRRYLLRQEWNESNARTYPRRIPLAIERAFGPYVQDVDGNVFLDFLAGAGALPLGHSHPEVIEAVERQLRVQVHGLDLPTPIKDEFTETHLALLPAPMAGRMKMHFCGPTGANAVEAALKLCKTYTGRSGVVSFQGGFHGATHGAMAVSGLVDQIEPVPGRLPGVSFFPYSYCLRCPLSLSPDTCSTNCAEYLRASLADSHGGVPKPAAIILELVQGEGGVIPATATFARTIADIAHEQDIPLIVDEIQTGYGRVGTWFAFEQYGIEPDVIIVSKALGGIGLPVAVMFYDRRMDTWAPGAHIGTFRGHQLAFAGSIAALSVMRRDNVLDNVREQGGYLRAELDRMAAVHPFVGQARGMGLMLGIEIVDPRTGAPDGSLAGRIQRAALLRGLIIEIGGRQDAVVRFLPPLNISRETATVAMSIMSAALDDVAPRP